LEKTESRWGTRSFPGRRENLSSPAADANSECVYSDAVDEVFVSMKHRGEVREYVESSITLPENKFGIKAVSSLRIWSWIVLSVLGVPVGRTNEYNLSK
jgi:hypothetical protein